MVLKRSFFVFAPNTAAMIEMQASEMDSDIISRPSGPSGGGEDEDGSLMMNDGLQHLL